MVHRLQRFFILLIFVATPLAVDATLQPGQTYALTFRDVDGNTISTANGHVTIITVVTRRSEEQARAISRLVPDRYLGDPRYRYITLVNFQRGLASPFHGITRAVIRGRLDSEAKKLRPQYAAKKITRDPRDDVYVIADFDGSAVTKLGISPESNDVAVFVFNRGGNLVQRWIGVPPGDSLARAIAAAEG